MRIWRISRYADLSGLGGEISAGRWNQVKTPIVYCADHPATALLEILVHVDAEDLPQKYQLLEIEVPDPVQATSPDLAEGWTDDLMGTQRIGSDFIRAAMHSVMRVPCVIVPFTNNFLLNPALLERDGIGIVGVTEHPFDARLLS